MTRFDVLGVGRPYVDLLLVLSRLPHADEILPVQEMQQQGGGPVPTALVAVSRLGASAAIWGVLGDDQNGRFNQAEFRRYGVDTRHLRLVPGADSPLSVILVDRSSGTRTILPYRGKVEASGCRAVDEAVLRNCSVVHMSGSYVDEEIETARRARRLGVLVSLDGGNHLLKPGMDRLIELTDILVAARGFAEEATGSRDLEGSAAQLSRMGPRTVVITDGAAGSWGWSQDGEQHFQPAFSVPVIDTTGAGDVYHGAFLYGLVRGYGLRDTMQLASAAAALKCTRVGGRAGIPSFAEVEAFLAERRGAVR